MDIRHLLRHPLSVDRWPLTLAWWIALGCADSKARVALDIEIGALDTIVTQESQILGNAGEIAVGPGGMIFVTDAQAHEIIRLRPDGSHNLTLGREGSGPGEFRFPRSTHVARDSLRVLDAGNGRIQVLDPSGGFRRSSPAPSAVTSGAVSFSGTGAFVVSLNGRDSSLAQRFDSRSEPGVRLGTPVAPPQAVWDFSAIKAEIAEGRVPAALRNITLPVLEDGGAVWLILVAEGVVQRFSSQDAREWSVALAAAEFALIEEDFFQRNREETDPGRFIPLSYIVSARPYRRGLLMLLRMPEGSGTMLLYLDRQGCVVHRIRIPRAEGVRAFAVDEGRRSIYLVAYYDAVLVRAELPDVLLEDP